MDRICFVVILLILDFIRLKSNGIVIHQKGIDALKN